MLCLRGLRGHGAVDREGRGDDVWGDGRNGGGEEVKMLILSFVDDKRTYLHVIACDSNEEFLVTTMLTFITHTSTTTSEQLLVASK